MPNILHNALIQPHLTRDAPFLTLSNGIEISFRDFFQRAARFVNVLHQSGLEPGDRVLVQAPKSADMLALYVATVQAGGVFLPLNTGYTAAELTYFAGNARPKVIVCDPKSLDQLTPIAQATKSQMFTLGDDETGSLCDLADQMPVSANVAPRSGDDLAALLYTSGTTGRSKGAMLSHDNLLSNAQALVDHWQMAPADRLLHALPIFHTHGLFVAVNACLLAGASMIFLQKFDLDQIVAHLPGSTMLMGVPTFYTRLLGDQRLQADLACDMRVFISGSAPLLSETHDAFYARTGHRILERYGMTETNMNTSNPYDGERRAGTVGQPLPGIEVRITEPGTTLELPQDQVGMIEVRGPNVFQGYWEMPEKTAEELRPDGFFITGDLGKFDTDGYLHIVGRQKDLIISGGYNIYPKEIEDVLNDVPGVLETAVIGLPDADLGEIVAAVVVCSGSVSVDEITLQNTTRAQLAKFKQPKVYYFVDSLPRNTMGKVQKNTLRQTYS